MAKSKLRGTGSAVFLVSLAVIFIIAVTLAVIYWFVLPGFQVEQEVKQHYAACEGFIATGDWDAAITECEAAVRLKADYRDVQDKLRAARDGWKEKHYQQGAAAEAVGDLPMALDEYRMVFAQDAGYKDVRDKVQMAALALTPTATPTPSVTPTPTIGPSPTATPLPSDTPLPTATATETPLPPTRTSTPPPMPPSFSDDFDNGYKPEWQVVSGKWGTIQGQLTLISIADKPASGLVMIGNDNWNNYAVEFDVTGFYDNNGTEDSYSTRVMNDDVLRWTYSRYTRSAILLGMDAPGEGTGLIMGATRWAWGTLSEDGWQLASSIVDGYGEEGEHVRIEVRGSVYKVYVEDKEVTSFSDDSAPGGRVAIWLTSHQDDLSDGDWRAIPKIDNFVVMPLE